jgi:hypothetical protein
MSSRYIRINSQPDTFGTRGSQHEPVGHGRSETGAMCPACQKKYVRAGGSCGTCADERGVFVMIKPLEGNR